MKYKVVIPSAGLGSRIGPYTKYMNKALMTLGDKPAISRVIDKFDENIEVVILLGYLGPQLSEIICTLYPSRKLTFVDVDKYEGPGSGLGYSLLRARQDLNCPFIFIPNDTIVPDSAIDFNPIEHGNWVGRYSKKIGDGYDVSAYRTLEIDEAGGLSAINAKGVNAKDIYIGLCGINDYRTFWETMETNANAITVGEALGLQSLKEVKTIEFPDWLDCGNISALKRAKKHFQNPDVNILDKEDEAIWFSDGHVIKFSADNKFIADRIKRLDSLPKNLFPKIVDSGVYFYKYPFLNGKCLSHNTNNRNFKVFLDTCQSHLWSNNTPLTKKYMDYAYQFYNEKTFTRLNHYLERYEQTEINEKINGKFVDTVHALLCRVKWNDIIQKSIFSHFHGDLHGENILTNGEDFYLIDWRQNFGDKNYEYGDVYYDLGKLLHGMIVNHGVVEKGLFKVASSTDGIQIDIYRLKSLVDAELEFKKWCEEQSYSWLQVKFICALIFINICGLHEWPYAKFLYYLGRHMLHELVEEQKL